MVPLLFAGLALIAAQDAAPPAAAAASDALPAAATAAEGEEPTGEEPPERAGFLERAAGEDDSPTAEPPEKEAPPVDGPQVVLLMTPSGPDVDERVRSLLGLAIAAAFDGRDDVEVLAASELKAAFDLSAMRQQTGCSDDETCLAAIAVKLDAQQVVTTRVGRVGQTWQLTLSRFEAGSFTDLGRVTREASDEGALMEAATDAVRELFGWSAPGTARYTLAGEEQLSLAVFPLATTGVDDAVATNLTEAIASELKRIDGATIVGLSDVKALLEVEAQRSALGCSDDLSCLAEIGGALGVTKVVTGEVGRVGDRYVLGLRVLDREKVRVDRRITEAFSGPEDQLLPAVRHAARQLVSLESGAPGSLLVTSSKPGSTLFIDGEQRGRSPGPPIDGLRAGRHTVRVSAPGFLDWQGDLYVAPGQTTAQWIQLEEEPGLFKQFLPLWVFGGLAAATATLTAGSLVALGAAELSRLDHAGRNTAGAEFAVGEWGALQTRTTGLAVVGLALGGAAVIAAGATALTTPFTRWSLGE